MILVYSGFLDTLDPEIIRVSGFTKFRNLLSSGIFEVSRFSISFDLSNNQNFGFTDTETYISPRFSGSWVIRYPKIIGFSRFHKVRNLLVFLRY